MEPLEIVFASTHSAFNFVTGLVGIIGRLLKGQNIVGASEPKATSLFHHYGAIW